MPFGAELRDGGVAFRLWAPSRERATVVRRRRRARARAARRRLVRAHGRRGARRLALRFRASRARRCASPIPLRASSPTACTRPSEVVDPRAYAWREHGLARPRRGTRSCSTSCTSERSRPRARTLRRVGAARRPRAARRDRDRADAARAACRRAQLGLRRRAAVRAAARLRHARRAQGVRSTRAHARGLSVFLDVVYNHFGPEGNYLHAFAQPFFTERHHTPWGAAINVDGERRGDRARALRPQRALLAARIPLRRPALRRGARDPRRLAAPVSRRARRARARRRRAGRHVHLVLENDANEARLLDRFDAQWNDDAHHAFHVLLTGETRRLLPRLRATSRRVCSRARSPRVSRIRASRRRTAAARRAASRSAALPATAFVDFLQNHDQIGNRAFGERIGDARAAGGRARRDGRAAAGAGDPAALHGRGVGGVDAVSVLLRLRPRARCGGDRRPPPRVRRLAGLRRRCGARSASPTRRIRPRCARRCCAGTNARTRRTRRCSTCTASCSRCATGW